MKESSRVLIALVAAVVGGILIAASGSSTLLNAADFIAPIGTIWVNAIRMTVIPLVVGALIVGITSAPNARSIESAARIATSSRRSSPRARCQATAAWMR